jgi:hypothetical protein
MGLEQSILQLLAEHGEAPVDYVALFMFLNTVAGGHYQETHSETAIRGALASLLQRGEISAWAPNGKAPLGEGDVRGPDTVYRITPTGREAMLR